MGKPHSFEKPTGFRDFLPPLAEKKRLIEEQVHRRFLQWGYQEIHTPSLEFKDTVGEASQVAEQKMFKCMDHEGNTLVLKPDHTAPIARAVAAMHQTESLPIRLCYHGPVFRAQESETGRKAEFFQSGVELLGISGTEGDVEVMLLALESIKACEITAFQLSIGHIAWLDAWLDERLPDQEERVNLKRCLVQRDLVGYRQQVATLSLDIKQREELLAVLRIQSQPGDFGYFRERTESLVVHQALDQLQEVFTLLTALGYQEQVVFDPSLVGSLDYYTGIVFEGYAQESGFPLLSGGRYDHLLAHFRHPLPATGFALRTERLMEVSPLRPAHLPMVEIIYTEEHKEAAFSKADSFRKNGHAVILRAASVAAEQTQPAEDRQQIWML